MFAVINPQSVAVLVKHKRNRNESDGQKSEQTAAPVDAELVEHGGGEKRESSTESRPHKIVSGVDRGHIRRVRITEIVQSMRVVSGG